MQSMIISHSAYFLLFVRFGNQLAKIQQTFFCLCINRNKLSLLFAEDIDLNIFASNDNAFKLCITFLATNSISVNCLGIVPQQF